MFAVRIALVVCLVFVVATASAQEREAARLSKSARVDKYGDPLPDGAIARLAFTKYRGNPYLKWPHLLPDRRHFAVVNNGSLDIWNLDTDALRTIDADLKHQMILEVAYSADGHNAVVGGWFLTDKQAEKEGNDFRVINLV